MQLSLWRRFAIYLLWKILQLLPAIRRWWQHLLSKQEGPISETRRLEQKNK